MKNKKASKLLSVYWFAILFIVAGAIAYMVVLFYGSPYDVRDIESNALQMQIANCMAQGGYLREDVFSEDFKNNFLADCNLNLAVENEYGWEDGSEYYIEVQVAKFDESAAAGFGEGVFRVAEGNSNLKTFGRDVDRIVIHYTETATLKAATDEFEREDSKSIHYIIDKDGTVFRGEVGEDEIGFHSGCKSTRPKCDNSPDNCCIRGMNERSIGIELVNTGKEPYPDEQIVSLEKLIAEIATRREIPIDREHVIGHEEVDVGRKEDPGALFPWDRVIQEAGSMNVLAPNLKGGFYALDESGNGYVVDVFTAVGKEEKNAP